MGSGTVRRNGGVDDLALYGTLAAFIRQPDNHPQPGLYKVVAGGGIEPPTCGL